MNPWKALYIKEMKDNRGIFLFLLVTALGLELYVNFRTLSVDQPSPYMLLGLAPFLSVLILPFVLANSFSQEFKAETHYQLLSLPVSRSLLVGSKFLAVLSVGIGLFVLAMIGIHLLYLQLEAMDVAGKMPEDLFESSIWLQAAIFYLSALLPLMGFASAMAGMKLLVRRFQMLMTILFLMGSGYLYGRILQGMLESWRFLRPFKLSLMYNSQGELESIPVFLQVPLLSLLMTMILLGIGLWLYEKKAEA